MSAGLPTPEEKRAYNASLTEAQDASSAEFMLGHGMSTALDKAKELAAYLEGLLHTATYLGPVVIAGGYVRDMALGKPWKDRDVFLDAALIENREHFDKVLALLCAQLTPTGGLAVQVARIVDASYGVWAVDVAWVATLFDPNPEPRTQFDIVVLHRAQLMDKAGYEPKAFLEDSTRASFLKAVLRRVDVRLNAIGASASNTDNLPMWRHDVLAKRLVIQASRLEEEPARIYRRLKAMTEPGAKYEGWKVLAEGPNGDLIEPPTDG